MSRSIKFLCVLIFFLGGCAPIQDKPKDGEVVFADPIGEKVNSPVSIAYVWNNPIKIRNITVTETPQIYASSLQIEGLKDKTVEDKINKAIQTRFDALIAYQDLSKLPPYRGIRLKVKEGAVLNNFNAYASVSYNANYVLGICFNLYAGITNPDNTQTYVSVSDGLSFELIHGNTLHLSDVFTNDADISKLVNDSVSTTLRSLNSQEEELADYYWYGHLTQVAPFTGIQADQPFYISDQGLHLIIDYRTPIFETNQASYSITVPYSDFSDNIGITRRFVSDTDIFVDPIIDRQFLYLTSAKDIHQVESFDSLPDTYLFKISYPNDLEPSAITLMTTAKEKIKQQLIDYVALHKVSYLSGNVSVSRIGPYFCIYASGEAVSDPDTKFINEVNCYDKSLHRMNLSDYFKPGFDYETRIKALIQEDIDQGYLPNDISVDEIYSTLSIQLYSTGFYLSGQAYSASLGQMQFFGLNPAFSSFGVENLTLFDE